MRHPLTLAVTMALTAPAFAQTAAPTVGTVQDVVVVGTTDLLANFVKAALNVQPGSALSSVNLRQVEQDVVATGYFKSAVATLQTVGGKDVLNIAVVPNPTIHAVNVSGFGFLPGDDFKTRVGELLNIAPGATLNTSRLDQAKEALAQNYQQQGFPFTPNISTAVKPNADGTVDVSFVVDETAPISRIEVENVTLLPQATVASIFKPLYDAKKFTTEAFFAASDALQRAYSDAGYIQAGIAPGSVTLDKGVLKVKVSEGKIDEIDTSALGDVKSALQSQVGQAISLTKLQQDVRTLANETGKPVGFALQPDQSDPSKVTVFFGAADVEGGPIKSIVFAGNTKVPTSVLQAALKTKVGDVYSPQLAQDDFMALREAYRKAGYEISTRDAITFKDGVLTFNMREVTLVGYELAWQGPHKTKDRVILRELPEAGKTFNLSELRDALGRVSRLGFVTVTGENVVSKDPANPENVTYVLQLTEAKGGIPVNLALSFDSMAGGWGGEAGYSNDNVLGLGHRFAVNAGAQQNQAGQNWVGNMNYTIPWLDLNFGDFKKNRTSLGLDIYSNVGGNNALLDDSKTKTGREYTVRTTGFGLNLGRNITPNLSASAGVSFNYRTYFLEPIQSGESSNVDDSTAGTLLSKENVTTRFQGSLGYDNTDNPDFPGRGMRANGLVAYNFGRSGSTPLGWTDTEVGVSKYYGFGGTTPQQFGVATYKNVLAGRVNYGTSFGNYPDGTGYYIGGASPNPTRELRGLDDGQLFGTSYLTSSLEYRRDLGISNSFAQGLYGVLWADYGGVWNSGGAFKSAYGVGAGLQANLGINGSRLVSLRFDYGFSPQRVDTNGNQAGSRFMFRIGNFW